jgi:predicted ATPase
VLSRITILNYRTLRYIDQRVSNVQVLIGPNASGKSTFLDVIAFIADLLGERDILRALDTRTPNFTDLTWMRQSEWFELAVEAVIPDEIKTDYRYVRYELRLGLDMKKIPEIQVENLWLLRQDAIKDPTNTNTNIPDRITLAPKKQTPPGWRKIVSKSDNGNDYFRSEKTDWNNMFRLGSQRVALANLPEDEERFPVATWFKRFIGESVQKIMLSSEALRRPSPPAKSRGFLTDGSNLPWVIHELEQKYPENLVSWVEHIRTALPEIQSVRTVERPEDRHKYLMVTYQSGLEAPSWVISDGTLRLLALTILAYVPNLTGIYMIEEPENGIHPRAVETIYQSLQSLYDAQLFMATHSPIILNMADLKQLLCFERHISGETHITAGYLHPYLKQWQGEISLGTLFASGVLG